MSGFTSPDVADEATHVFAYHADALTFLRTLPADWCHAIITDPPYGLADHKPDRVVEALTAWASGDRERVPTGRGFMGREWDAFVPPPALWDECLRVLKPGGHLAVFAGSRTVDLMGLSIRLAGFEMRDGIAAWLYGSGFPKSLDVGKAIDKRGGADIGWFGPWLRQERRRRGISSNQLAEHFPSRTGGMTGCVRNWELGLNLPTVEQFNTLRRVLDLPFDDLAEAEREVVGAIRNNQPGGTSAFAQGGIGAYQRGDTRERNVLGGPATDAAREWDGWGTALKPAHEPILLARKPLDGTVAGNVLAHRAGGINVDACRVGGGEERPGTLGWGGSFVLDGFSTEAELEAAAARGESTPDGRSAAETLRRHQERKSARTIGPVTTAGRWPTNVVLAHHPDCHDEGECAPDCQVAALDAQSGTTTSSAHTRHNSQRASGMREGGDLGRAETGSPADQGGASRFFPTFRYQAKAPKSERPMVDGRGHPTVKPLGLMRWLVRLLVPVTPGHAGMVVDPFAGSGATLEAARLEGVRAVGIERDEHSARLIAARLGVEFREPAVDPVTTSDEAVKLEQTHPRPEDDPDATFAALVEGVLSATSAFELRAIEAAAGEWWTTEHAALAALRALELGPAVAA